MTNVTIALHAPPVVKIMYVMEVMERVRKDVQLVKQVIVVTKTVPTTVGNVINSIIQIVYLVKEGFMATNAKLPAALIAKQQMECTNV